MATINGVKVSIAEMKSTKTSLSNDNSDIMTELNKVDKSMDDLKGTEVWSSEGATAIQSKFDQLYPKFKELNTAVEEYVTYLENTISKYDTTETAVVSSARNVSDWA